MADTVEPTETVVTEPLKNEAPAPTTPVVEKTTDDSEVEKARKEAEQAKMEANMLRNKLAAKEKAEADAEAKRLEEQNEYKTLYEQNQAKLAEIEREKEAEEQQKAVKDATDNVLADYPDEVKAIAEDTGLNLGEVSEEAVAEFKAKLDKIQTRLGATKVTPNNPGVPSGKKEYTGEELRQILADPVKRDAYYRAKDGVTAMMMDQPRG